MSDKKPLVSFYMTVKNGIKYINESIESIKSQTYPNWEAVIVDDGSSDGTPEYLDELQENDSRFLIVKTVGVGRGAALNLAVQNTSGRYLANLDADDLCSPIRAEVQVEILEKFNIDFVCGDTTIIYDNEGCDWSLININNNIIPFDVSEKLLRGNPISHIGIMFTRRVFDLAQGYDSERKAQLDYDLWIRLYNINIPLYKVNICVGAKRIHDLQSFEYKGRWKYLLSAFKLKVNAIYNNNGCFYLYIVAFSSFFYGLLPRFFRSYIRNKKIY